MLLSAVLFDVDGTIAESEELHRISFNESLKNMVCLGIGTRQYTKNLHL